MQASPHSHPVLGVEPRSPASTAPRSHRSGLEHPGVARREAAPTPGVLRRIAMEMAEVRAPGAAETSQPSSLKAKLESAFCYLTW